MKVYVWLTFAALGLGYYELSGGESFTPGDNGVSVFAKVTPAPTEFLPDTQRVTRLSLVEDAGLAPNSDDTPASQEQVALEAAVLTALRSEESAIAVPSAEMRVSMVLPVAELENADLVNAVADAQDAAPQEAPVVELDMRLVNGSRVNLRQGPGQNHAVLDKLSKGTKVQILSDPGQGWVQLQVVPQGVVGWTADYLLDKNG